MDLVLTDAAKEALVREGYDPTYGARPLRRVIQRQVENSANTPPRVGPTTEEIAHTLARYPWVLARSATVA